MRKRQFCGQLTRTVAKGRHNARMHYRLHPDVAVTWDAGDQLRVGTSVHSVTVPDTQLAHDLIDLLRQTAPLRLLEGVAASTGTDPLAASTTLRRLVECCERVDGGSAQLHVAVRSVRGGDELAQSIAAECMRHGARVTLGGAHATLPDRCDVVIEICNRGIEPRRYLPHLHADRAHLLVTRDAASIILGPFVVPGTTACIRCGELRRLHADPNWLVAATQLIDLPAPARHPELELITALECGMFVRSLTQRWGRRPAQHSLTGLRFVGMREVVTQLRRWQIPVAPDRGCGCQTPAESDLEHRYDEPKTTAGVFARG